MFTANDTNESPAKRIPLSVEVEFKKNYARQINKGVLLNISVTGAFLKIDGHSFETGEKLSLKFVVGARERDLSAKVVWVNQYGAGVQFQHSNNRDLQIIDDLMYYVEESRQDRKQVLEGIFKLVA